MGCRTTDFLISRLRQDAGAPPFIGLLELDDASCNRGIERTRQFLDGRPERLDRLFNEYPNIAAWLVAWCLSEEYGSDSRDIYPHISRTLGVPLDSQQRRTMLSEAFCGACDRFGLPTKGLKRDVDVYLLHVGVSRAQVPHLIDAFLRQEAAFGPPPAESTALLNRWEDDSLEFLAPGIKVPRRSIIWDETAWHARLFANMRRDLGGFVPTSRFEEHFKMSLEKRLTEGRADASYATGTHHLPQPRLYWQSGGLVLRLPRSEGRITIWIDGSQKPLRLRGGEDWPVPQPWPTEVRWEIAGQAGQIELLAHPGVAVFDRVTGHCLRELPQNASDAELDSADIAILSRAPFDIDGEPACEQEAGSNVGFAELSRRPVLLKLDGDQIVLRARPRRRLSITGDEIASGPRGLLHGRSARMRIETGLARAETRAVRVTIDNESRLFTLPISDSGFGEVVLEELLAEFPDVQGADPLRLRAELMAPVADGGAVYGSGITLSAWVWPGYHGSDGISFQSALPVRNLVESECLHAGLDGQGRLCLDARGAFSVARAVFEIDGSHVSFDLPWPDVSIERRRSEGSPAWLPLGTRLSVGEDDRFDTIRIRCPDQRAQLIVRGRRETHPFYGGLVRSLAVRDLLAPASDEQVILQRASGVEVLLFELVAALAPQEVKFLPAQNAVRMRLKFGEAIDAVAAEVEDESGVIVLAEVALRHRPVATRRPAWFHAKLSDDDADCLELTLESDWLDDGPRLARLLIRSEGRDGWRPLRNSRGDSFAVALVNPSAFGQPQDAVIQGRFEKLCNWLSDCFASECWPVLEHTLVPRWRELGLRLRRLPGGDGAVMRAASLPPPDHAASGWVPILHPLQFAPDLYAAPAQVFASLATSIDAGVAELSALATLNTSRLRELSHLHPTVYFAFRNVQEANAKGIRLEGFDPASLFRNLPVFDRDPNAGWFWRGLPLLGPEHWRAAHLRFVERLDAAALFVEDAAEEGPNSRRQEALLRLMHAAWKSTPDKLRPPAPKRSEKAREPTPVDLWASALLSAFAQASRMNEVSAYLEKLSKLAGVSTSEALTGIAFLLRFAPELFAFHLLLWQIARERP